MKNYQNIYIPVGNEMKKRLALWRSTHIVVSDWLLTSQEWLVLD